MIYLRIALLAPGIMLHEFSHHLLCFLTGVRVKKAVYFRIGNPAGFIIHEEPELYRQAFGIVVGPLFINSAASIVLINFALRQAVRAVDPVAWGIAAAFLWLGVSAALEALPSRTDASNLLQSSNHHVCRGNPFAIIGYPVVVAVYLLQLTRPLGGEWLYAILMAYVAQRGFATLG